MTRYHKLSIHKEMFREDFDNVLNEFGGKILGFGNMWVGLGRQHWTFGDVQYLHTILKRAEEMSTLF